MNDDGVLPASCHHKEREVLLMPRRPPEILSRIPVFLIPSMIRDAITKAGEELVKIVIKKGNHHYYNITIHTRSIKRELRAGVQRTGGAPV